MHGHEHGQDGDFRPRGDRAAREEQHDDLAAKAAVAGRTDVLGAGGLLGLQRAVGNAGVTSMIEEERSPVLGVVNSGGGVALDRDTQADMEGRFGTSFGDVRVHTDSAAHDSAKSVNAQAYTVGSNIVFQNGKYDPGSDAGKHMLAHELTHVVQQRSGPVDGTDTGTGVRVSDPSDRFERAAVANAERAMAQPAAPTAQRTPDTPTGTATVQRDEAPPEEEEAPAQTFVQRDEEEQEDQAP
jgi:hypothetical protein